MTSPVLRHIARVVLIDAQERVLLFRMRTLDGRTFWCPPGGGLEPGESHHEAALRELREETGWAEPAIQGPLGHRQHVVTWHDGLTYDCREAWFTARVDRLDVDESGWTDDERLDMDEHRWWSVAEFEASRERFVPADLASVVRSLLTEGLPAQPWEFRD